MYILDPIQKMAAYLRVGGRSSRAEMSEDRLYPRERPPLNSALHAELTTSWAMVGEPIYVSDDVIGSQVPM